MDNILNIHKNYYLNTKTLYINITSFKTYQDCKKIIDIINHYYKLNENFILFIETKELQIENIGIQCLYNFSFYLNTMKKNKHQYLKKNYNNNL